jgi:glycosyltransferase involved in cell wall biosynthesis
MVSVVIPAFNAGKHIGKLLDSLDAVEYPKDLLEVIVVDNGSSDDTVQVVRQHSVSLVTEASLHNPGTARNAGVRRAKGEVIAFIDADCFATGSWIVAALATMHEQQADVVAGRVQWDYSTPRNAAEFFDSLVHLRNDITVPKNGTAVTANLLVRAAVFQKTGLFPEWKAGEDGAFCLRAAAAGYRLVYSNDVVVVHKPRKFRSLLRKAWRVGSYYRNLCMVIGRTDAALFHDAFRSFIPGTSSHVRRLVRERGTAEMEAFITRMWLISYLYSIVWGSAALASYFRKSSRSVTQ